MSFSKNESLRLHLSGWKTFPAIVKSLSTGADEAGISWPWLEKMKYVTYKQILEEIENINDVDCTKKLSEKFPNVKDATLGSIYAQWMQRRVKKNYHRITHPKEISSHYDHYQRAVNKGEPPGIIIRLAQELSFSPAMLAKVLLEHYLNLIAERDGIPSVVTKRQVNKLLRNTTLIQDRELSYEVYLCLLKDDVYGPFADSFKHSVGHEYEFMLKKKLESLNISYQDETVLRNSGYDKTPDIKLDIPIAIDGHVVNWIESKASFGDEESHKIYLKDQFWSYWNRFGPGLVIYWFGFIDEVDEHTEKGIMIKDELPENITFMNPIM